MKYPMALSGEGKHSDVLVTSTDERDHVIIRIEPANARLIAAAPELLAACEEALECLRFEVEETGPTKDKLVAAIALAKGQL